MTAIEMTAQQFWQGSALARSMPHAHILPKALHPSLIAHHNTPGQLLQAWLAHVQRQQEDPASATLLRMGDFASEEALLQAVLGPQSAIAAPDRQRLLAFCRCLQRQHLEALKQRTGSLGGVEGVLKGAKQAMAKLVCLVERRPDTVALVDGDDVAGSLDRINRAFDAYVEGIISDMGAQLAQHDRAPLQNSSQVAVALKPRLIADLLLTSGGHLNLGLIDIIKHRFFAAGVPLLRHDQELKQTLDILAGSVSMQNQIHAIGKPCSPHLAVNDLMRVSLKLAPEAPLDGRQAKWVALAALLSDMRQGDVSSCFSTSVAIMMMDALKEKVLGDFIELLSRGKLTRAGRADQQEFIPVLEIGDSALAANITLESSGKMVSGTGYLWEAPGLIAACRQLGIADDDMQGCIEAVIAQLYVERALKPGDLLEVTVQSMIRRLVKAQAAPLLDRSLRRELKNRALLAFSAETHCPLLRAWESCLAAMAEAQSTNLVRRKITKCLAAALGPHWPRGFFGAPAKDAQRVQQVFANVVNHCIQLRYDPQVLVQSGGHGDGHSKILGAFTLHALKQGKNSLLAKPVETPEQFKRFVLNQLRRAGEILTKADGQDLPEQLALIDHLHAFVSRPDELASSFVKTAIRHYDVRNGAISDPLQVWRQLEHLPFRDAVGNDAATVYLKATGVAPGQPHTVRPKNGEELLRAFIAFGRARAQADQFLADDNPYQRYLATTTQHAFTLTPEDPSIVGAMDPAQTADQWILAHIIAPGQQVARLPMDGALKLRFHQAVCGKLLDEKMAPGFMEAVKKISATCNTVALYGNELRKLLLGMHAKPDVRLERALSKQLTDLLLTDVLPSETVAALTASAVRIADTNWEDKGARHLVFACFYNPLSQAVELATLDEEGRRLAALNQDEWVTYIPWEMYGVKL